MEGLPTRRPIPPELESDWALPQRAGWGTVREDYSADGQAWQYFPYEHARSRALSLERGMVSPASVTVRNASVSHWRFGTGAIRSSRNASLGAGSEGNHGEDAKEYWWYIDATPTA
jgi:hypothetical protein